MHAAALVGLALLLIGPAGASPFIDVEFQVPAQAEPSITAANATWALLIFAPGQSGSFDVDFPAASQDTNITLASLLSFDDHDLVCGTCSRQYERPVQTTSERAPFHAQATFNGPGSLYLHGSSIQLKTEGVRANLAFQIGKGCLDHPFADQERKGQEARYGYLCLGDAATAVLRPTGTSIRVSLAASGLDVVEWHHAQILCRDASCPDGGARTDYTVSTPPLNVTNRMLNFHSLASHDAKVGGTGEILQAIVGGQAFDLAVNGRVRLPVAVTKSCPSCVAAEDQTLSLEGNITLHNLHRDGDHLATSLGGNFSSARLDEASVEPRLLFSRDLAKVAAAALVGGVIVWLAFLFSRSNKVEGKRLLILEAIQSNPGANVPDLQRLTGIASSTLDFHLARLRAAGHIIQRKHAGKLCFFENHGRYGNETAAIAALRKPHQRRLYEWLEKNPGISGARLVQETATWGWHESTTYYRLSRLEKVALVRRIPNTRTGLLYAQGVETGKEPQPAAGGALQLPGDPA